MNHVRQVTPDVYQVTVSVRVLEPTATAENAIAIGYQTTAAVANEIVIGNASHTAIGGSVNWNSRQNCPKEFAP